MAFDGAGNYVRIHNWQQDAANGLNISAPEMDGEDNSIAGAFSLCVTRDGQGKMMADFLPNVDNTLNLGSNLKRWAAINGVPIGQFVTYPQTAAEAVATVTPTFFFYAPGDVRRYGAIGNGSTDDSAALQRAVSVLNATVNGNGPPQMVLYGWHPINGTLTVTQAGVAIRGLTSSQGTCGLLQTGNVDTLILQNATPANGIRNCALYDFTIMSNSATPTAGRGLVCNYCQNLQVSNLQVVTCFQGVNILGGFAQNWVNTLIFGPAGWTTRQAGTYCIRIEMGPANSIPSEISFTNFDWKGVTNVTNGTDFGIWILSGDGIFFSNGHIGFAYTASCAITTSAGPNFVDSLNFTNVYFDGNFGGNGSGLQITGAAGNIANTNFNSCSFRNHVQHGITCSYGGTSFTNFSNCNVQSNGLYGVIWNGGVDFSFLGGLVFNNNTSNTGANAFSIAGISNYTIQGVKIYGTNGGGGGFAYPVGISVDVASSGGSIVGNSFKFCNIPMVVSAPFTTFAGNRLLGAIPSVVAAAALPATMLGFDYIQVTGNTAITSFAGANIAGQEMTLAFTGTPTVTRGNNILLTTAGGNMVATAGSTLRVANDGTGWREVARAVA